MVNISPERSFSIPPLKLVPCQSSRTGSELVFSVIVRHVARHGEDWMTHGKDGVQQLVHLLNGDR